MQSSSVPSAAEYGQWVEHGELLSAEELYLLRRKGIYVNKEGGNRLEQATRKQAESDIWHSLCRVPITASNFGAVFKRQNVLFTLKASLKQFSGLHVG